MDGEKIFILFVALIMFFKGQLYIFINENKWFNALGGFICALSGALFVAIFAWKA